MDRGYVIEEAIVHGKVMNKVQAPQNSLQFEVPEQSLFSSRIMVKKGEDWKKKDLAILTTKHWDEFPISDITKIKIKKESNIPKHVIIKICSEKAQNFYAISNHQTYQWFYKVIWACMLNRQLHSDPNEQFINLCEGQVLKKGEILGGWEPRYLLITQNDGLMSFRNKDQQPTLRIRSTHELWTRFETLNEGKFFVFKLWHGFIKEQFAVPIYKAVKWVKAFYSLLQI